MSESDRRLIDALQVWPRAPWSKLGPILGADPVTLTRRWKRLQEQGLAWVTVQQPWSSTSRGGIVEVECAGGALEEVIASVVADPQCVSVDVTSGGRDLVLTVSSTSMDGFGRYVVERVNRLAGVRAIRAQPAFRSIAVATQWRLRALDAAEAEALETAARNAATHPRRPLTEVDPEIGRLLSLDGRVTTQEVATALDVPLRKARERLAATLAVAPLQLRTDMPRWASGWPVAAWYFVKVPAAHLADVGTKLRTLRPVRAVLSVAGPANLLINVWLRDLGDVEQLEATIERQLPVVSVLDRSLVLSVRKRMTRVFDADEFPTGIVPWSA
ncbi:Lrp/AsnC family transcriptional regulator [Nocardioides insulae]|uniref:Lrp/AsnC family transcriptional regulator n=1 Tax=Nocardioides insulae TaxID=394734 RepID=UPI00041F971D|nr:Lrp/AsnC family transcriptional regulator [Nocardioides insulae]